MRSVSALLLAAAVVLSGTSTADSLTDNVVKAVEDGTVKLSFRYRFEFVEEDGFSEDAYASTLKSRLTFAPTYGEDWRFLLEFDDVRYIGNDVYNSTRNGQTNRPAVFDPDGTDLNQVLVGYSGFNNLDLVFGRQRINRGNQRYIGGVGWRQNEQTYDSFAASYGADQPLQLFYSYVFNVNRIWGPERGSPPRELESNIHLFDAKYAFSDALNVSGYLYLMDFDDAENFSNSTLGVRLDGGLPLGDQFKLSYVGEYASQEDHGDNPVNFDTDYYLLEAGLGWDIFNFMLGLEVLGGDDVPGGGFRTPLATLHKFQGWADRFAGVGGAGLDSGIEDLYAGVSVKLVGGTFQLIRHEFDAETGGSGELGKEWNASAAWTFAERYGLLIKFADYNAKSFSRDATKFWVQLTAAF